MISRKYVQTLIAVPALLALAALFPVSAATILGQTGTNGLFLNGHKVPSGTTLSLDSVLQTKSHPGLAHLNNGHALWLGPDSKIQFAAADLGVAIHVQAGLLAFNSEGSGIVTLAPTSVLVLDEQGQVQEGTRVRRGDTPMCELETEETIEFCHADPADSKCDWSREEVPQAEVQARLDEGWLIIGENDILNRQCQAIIGGFLGAGAITGIALGGAAAGYFVYDEFIDDDDDTDAPPASPVTP